MKAPSANTTTALHTVFGPAGSAELLLVGSAIRGPVGIPVRVTSIDEATSVFGITVVEERTLSHGTTTVELSRIPRAGNVQILSVNGETGKIQPDVLQGIEWDDSTATFYAISHVPVGSTRRFIFVYRPETDTKDMISVLEGSVLSVDRPILLLQATGSHGSTVIPTIENEFTATVASGSAVITVTDGLANIDTDSIVHIAGAATNPFAITDITGSSVTLDHAVEAETGSYLWYTGGGIALVTRYSGLGGLGYTANISSVTDGLLLTVEYPPWVSSTPFSFVFSSTRQLVDVVDELNSRARLGQSPVAASAISAHLVADCGTGEFQLLGATDGWDVEQEDWYDAVAAAVANVDLSSVSLVHVPLVMAG